MILLSLDTSSRDASIAVLKDEEVLLEYNFSSVGNLSIMLVPSLEFILKTLGLSVAHIDGFAVCIGPGLFTGIRVGMATVKGLAFAAGKPVVGVVSLAALAYKFADTRQNVISLIDAQKGEVYLGGYSLAGGEVIERIPPCLLKIAAIVPLLADWPDKIFTGSGAERHKDFLKSSFSECRWPYRSNFLANEIGKIALQRFRLHETSGDAQALLPFYLRQPDAETKLGHVAGSAD
ncbi:MAG: tRNA (adenosine(37)-N6)-threonylcarbamoyltransferase complex dimerization subunit type 1 TsaB [Candidatus Aminicenantes bacterium]|nr:tRNA (adenosine(37)-N6)-threonylcarbamoyltransferase complex dimerization subunit type 1 TsaB [Candidatus Aminicenantes bacterium]